MPHPYFSRKPSFEPQIIQPPSQNLGICVVIPSFDEPNLWHSLKSILSCKPTECDVEVIVVINYPEGSNQESVELANKCHEVVAGANSETLESNLTFHSLAVHNVPRKKAGVGYARMRGMDEAAWRLSLSANSLSVISCFDADSSCMDNYLYELEQHWIANPKTTGCSIRYEHPLHGDNFEPHIYNAIAQYELHLRYYIEAARWAGHPFAYHTMGSSMACSAEAYMQYGGMNSRKAGEDFYFLQKIIPHGNFTEMNSTCVFPSPRPSFRVPFGTGRAISQLTDNNDTQLYTYSMECWEAIAPFLHESLNFYSYNREQVDETINQLHPSLKEFLIGREFKDKLEEIKSNTSTKESFIKRFFLWFDSFLLMKYLNFASEKYFPKQPVDRESLELARKTRSVTIEERTASLLLELYREMQLNPWRQ